MTRFSPSSTRVSAPFPLSELIRRLRWRVPLMALALVFAHLAFQRLLFPLGEAARFSLDLLVYGAAIPLLVWLALGWIQREVARKERAETELTRMHTRVSLLLQVNRRLSEAPDEAAVAALALELPGEIVPAVAACALIRFDDHHQPMPVEYRGQLDETALLAWHRMLLADSLRLECAACQTHTAHRGQACSLFSQLPLPDVERVVCLPLQRQERQFAVLGLFLDAGYVLAAEERALLEAVAAEITVAFENVRLRVHELSTLYDITETLHSRLDLSGMMKRILARTVEASRADAGLVLLRETDGTLSPAAVAGDWQGLERLPLVESLAAGALAETAGEPVLAALQAAAPGTASVLCAPMLADAGAIGVIVLGSRRAEAFLYPQVRLVSIIAGQAALLAENARLYSQLEHQAVLAERGRLAREMHDGLAQTLGYLKLRAGQIAGWVLSGQTEQAGTALQELAQTADDAYLDLRTALDGLRVALDHPQPGDFGEELRRLAADFQRLSGVPVELSVEAEPDLSPARQAHLRSIVQESLANVRKHAQACRVRLQLAQTAGRAVLLIEDNGRGFEAGQEWPATRHGLRVMQERAALLGADLQVSTSPGAGTRVTLEWPVAARAAR